MEPGVQVVEGLNDAGRVEPGSAVVKVSSVPENIKKYKIVIIFLFKITTLTNSVPNVIT